MTPQDEFIKKCKVIVGNHYLTQDGRTFMQVIADFHLSEVKRIFGTVAEIHKNGRETDEQYIHDMDIAIDEILKLFQE